MTKDDGSKRHRGPYEKTKEGRAYSESTSWYPKDEAVFRKHQKEQGFNRTDFVREAIHGYDDKFEWGNAREEIKREVEEQFAAFVERFGTAAEVERDLLRENQTKAAALTQLLYDFHLLTVNITALLTHLDCHPPFRNNEQLMQAVRGEFHGEWERLGTTLLHRLLEGDERANLICDRIFGIADTINPSFYEVLGDISPLYNTAVCNVVLQVNMAIRSARTQIAQR